MSCLRVNPDPHINSDIIAINYDATHSYNSNKYDKYMLGITQA